MGNAEPGLSLPTSQVDVVFLDRELGEVLAGAEWEFDLEDDVWGETYAFGIG